MKQGFNLTAIMIIFMIIGTVFVVVLAQGSVEDDTGERNSNPPNKTILNPDVETFTCNDEVMVVLNYGYATYSYTFREHCDVMRRTMTMFEALP